MDLREIEERVRAEAASVAKAGRDRTATEVSRNLQHIADQLAFIRNEHEGGIDASMGKRSGWKVEI
ncbi:MAG: hypothetical protein ACYDGS_02575 [Thermoleophilia bacterium]